MGYTSLKCRFIIAAALLLTMVMMAFAALLYTSSKYGYYMERSDRAQQVYASYRAVSDHTYRKLNAMGETVEQGTLTNLSERYINQKALREALGDVRENIAAELTHVGDITEAAELEHFNQIEQIAEEIIRGSALMRTALETGDHSAASNALARLRSVKVEGRFNELIDEALEEEQRDVVETQLIAKQLNSQLSRLLTLIFLSFVIVCTFIFLSTWRTITRNLRAFETAAAAYQRGAFDHTVPDKTEAEFKGLAKALNQMASEVDLQRVREQATQQNLEATIENRTGELVEINRKLEQVSETRKQFLADISHELRTPLTIMQGEADFALRGKVKTSDQYIDALQRVKEQTVHMTRFVQDLLFVARAEDGKAPVDKRPVSLAPLVNDICNDFEIIAAQKKLQIVQSQPDYDLVVSADSGRLRQVITILLDNALRYSYSESAIEVTISHVNDQAIIEVKDQGIGLSYHDASQAFSRFYRGGGSGKASGTGLGLPVAKAIVDSHGGSIHLQGQEGKGTTAIVTLPADVKLRAVQ